MEENKKNKKKEKKVSEINVAPAINTNKMSIVSRGRSFEGIVVKKFPKRVVIEFERVLYAKKYERFYKRTTRIHSYLPSDIRVELGDLIRVQECRPLSKLIHHVVIAKVKSSSINQEVKK